MKIYLQNFLLMSKSNNYTSKNHSKHYLKCHLIMVTKYRKQLLIGNLDNVLKHIIDFQRVLLFFLSIGRLFRTYAFGSSV